MTTNKCLGSARSLSGHSCVPALLLVCRLHLLLARVHGGEVARPGLWDGVYAKAFIDSAATVVPDIR